MKFMEGYMNGICGFVTNKNIEIDVLEKMNNSLCHNNLKDGDLYFEDGLRKIGLAHKNLNISESNTSKEAVTVDINKNVVTIFNGNIYNHQELKRELEACGYKFKSNSDTELIIYAYKEWGIECLSRFNGAFSVSIYDKEQKKVFIARDRIGEKPLYYYINDGDFVFSSELKCIMSLPFFKKLLNEQSVYKYFIYGYIPTPQTIFKNTFKLYPGSYLEYKNNDIKIVKYWDLSDNQEKLREYSENEILHNIEKLFYNSLKLRMTPDLSSGVFLTKDLNSLLIAAMMSAMSKKPIKTFSLGFENIEYGESTYAKNISDCLNAEYHRRDVDSKEIIDSMPGLIDCFDEPFGDSSALPTYMQSKFAKQYVESYLSSDGGNELLCGYNRYKSSDNRKYLYSISPKIREPLVKLAAKIFNKEDKAYKYIDGNLIEHYREYISIINKHLAKKLILSNNTKVYKFELFDKTFETKLKKTSEFLDAAMLTDIKTYLADNVLTETDRLSKNLYLESRMPLLDYNVVEYAQKIPISFKYKNKELNYISKMLLEKYVPKLTLDIFKKESSASSENWLKVNINDLLLTYFESNRLYEQGILNKDEIERLIKEHNCGKQDNSRILWSVLFFQMWYEKNIS